MQGLLLVGGFGTRLKSITDSIIPKAMVDINGVPFLSILLDYLISQGMTEIILSTGFKHEIIENYFKEYYKNIPIKYVKEDDPLGTGGALYNAMSKSNLKDVVFAMNGDSFVKFNLKEMINYLEKNKTDGLILTRKIENCSRYGSLIVNKDNRIIDIKEKSKDITAGIINTGIYLLYPSNIIKAKQDLSLSDKFSFEEDLMPYLFKNYNYHSYKMNDYFIDIGIPEDYKRFCADYKQRRFE